MSHFENLPIRLLANHGRRSDVRKAAKKALDALDVLDKLLDEIENEEASGEESTEEELTQKVHLRGGKKSKYSLAEIRKASRRATS